MDIYTFLSLSKEEQARAITVSDYLSEREDALFKVQLYSMGDFYIEMFCTVKEGEIVKFKAFKSRRLLVPYLDNIMATVLA